MGGIRNCGGNGRGRSRGRNRGIGRGTGRVTVGWTLSEISLVIICGI